MHTDIHTIVLISGEFGDLLNAHTVTLDCTHTYHLQVQCIMLVVGIHALGVEQSFR